MDGFTLVDAGVAVIVLISAILAYSRGFVREVLAILGWIAAAVVAFYAAPQVEPLIKEIPVINEFLAESCELAIIAAFVAVFAVALIVLSIFVPLFAGAVQRSALGGIDQGLGFLFGIARGALLVIVALIVYDRVALGDPIPMVDDSRSALIFSQIQDTLADQIPAEVPTWIVDRYEELVGDCGIPATAPAAVTPAEAPADNN
ncbi:MAG: CvpA family protein [Alphaproteobacteria bacterium]|nr:CvpA family protein [Alphaproteobacteria bacterium]NNF25105.1 CvpA family protein [Paracoccaceae bacterium]